MELDRHSNTVCFSFPVKPAPVLKACIAAAWVLLSSSRYLLYASNPSASRVSKWTRMGRAGPVAVDGACCNYILGTPSGAGWLLGPSGNSCGVLALPCSMCVLVALLALPPAQLMWRESCIPACTACMAAWRQLYGAGLGAWGLGPRAGQCQVGPRALQGAEYVPMQAGSHYRANASVILATAAAQAQGNGWV
jgi:hypothetical protein